MKLDPKKSENQLFVLGYIDGAKNHNCRDAYTRLEAYQKGYLSGHAEWELNQAYEYGVAFDSMINSWH